MKRKYGIKFDVEKNGEALNVVYVVLERKLERNPDKQFRVDLRDDPLYPALCDYVKNNPLADA